MYSKLKDDYTTYLEARALFSAVSFISIDNSEMYEFVGIPLNIEYRVQSPTELSIFLSLSIGIAETPHRANIHKTQLYIFKFDESFSSISLQNLIDIEFRGLTPHLINDKIVLARLDTNINYTPKMHTAKNFMWFNGDNFVEIENTGACFKPNNPPERKPEVSLKQC